MDAFVRSVGLSLVGSTWHIFPNSGATYLAVLQESHLALHSWPEYELILLDIFICSGADEETLTKTAETLAIWLGGTLKAVAWDRR